MLRMITAFMSIVLAIGCAKQPVPDSPVRPYPDAFVPYEDFLAQNNASITHLRIGMTRGEVVALMKSSTTEVRDGPLSNPYRTESFQRGADIYEVLYYLTRRHPPFTPIRDWQATPVVLKNGTVVGWGQSALPAQRP